jgi:hypothetical protein
MCRAIRYAIVMKWRAVSSQEINISRRFFAIVSNFMNNRKFREARGTAAQKRKSVARQEG